MLNVLLSVTWSPYLQAEILITIGREKSLAMRYDNMVLTQCLAGLRVC